MDRYINFNGNLIPASQPVFTAASRAARFGDSLFETMRMNRGKILFADLHSSRLFNGLKYLKFRLSNSFNWGLLNEEIEKLTRYNDGLQNARIRLMVSRGEGSILDEPVNSPQFLIECWPVESYSFNIEGSRIGIFEDLKKNMDPYSNLKSANYLCSVMASLYAKDNGWDECLLLNHQNRVCDAAISNVFWVKGGRIFTSPLGEGGVAGIMRNYLLECLPLLGYLVAETPTTHEELFMADELFLTSVIKGVKWVKSLGESVFSNGVAASIFEQAIAPLTRD